MTRFRYSLASLFGLTFVAAIAFAILRSPSPLRTSAVSSGTVFVLTAATLVAAFRSGNTRAFATGFAICGWAYLLSQFLIMPDNLVTDRLMTVIYRALYGDVEHPLVGFTHQITDDAAREWAFHIVSHCFFALTFGFIGGVAGCFLQATDKKD